MLNACYLDFSILDIGLKNIDCLCNIDDDDLLSYKVLMTYIYLNSNDDGEAVISKEKMMTFFRTRLYRSISKEPKSVENTPKQVFGIYESKLFRELFAKTFYGNNLNKHYSKFKLNIPLEKKDIQHLSFKTFITTIHKDSQAKKSEAEKKKLLKVKRAIKNDRNIFHNAIEINKDFIYQELENRSLKYKDYLKLKSIVDTTNKKLDIAYDIKESGRHYSSIGLLKKELRGILLNDYQEYDISTAAPNFFLEVYKQITNEKLPQIEFYINNKKAFREQIAGLIKGTDFKNLSKDDKKKYYSKAKEILTMIFFGSKIKESFIDEVFNEELQEIVSVKFYETAIEESLEKGEYRRFINSDVMRGFLSEIVDLMDSINDYLKSNYYDENTRTLSVNNRVLTFRNKDKEVSKYSKSKALAFFYQSWESDFLLSARDTYIQETKDMNYFLLHDALFVKKDIDINLLENTKQNTEFVVKVLLEKE